MKQSFRVYIDQLKRRVALPCNPQRIISLVPSQTELLFDLGLGDCIVGRTKFCIHPSASVDIPIIGGTKKFRFEKIDELNPDLIIGNKEENYKDGIDHLATKYPVWVSDVYDISSAFDMITSVGLITNRHEKSLQIVEEIKSNFVPQTNFKNHRVIYLIWNKPYMCAGCNTFIDAILQELNLKNLISDSRYPEISAQQLSKLNPDIVLLSSEPFPFNESHLREVKAVCPHSKVLLVDGEMFSWYGTRLLKAGNYFKMLRTELEG